MGRRVSTSFSMAVRSSTGRRGGMCATSPFRAARIAGSAPSRIGGGRGRPHRCRGLLTPLHPSTGRDRQPCDSRAGASSQGKHGNRLPRRGAGRRHCGVRNASGTPIRRTTAQRRSSPPRSSSRHIAGLRLRVLCGLRRARTTTSSGAGAAAGACGVKVFMARRPAV